MTTFGEWRRGEGRDASATELALPEAARLFQGERAGFPTRLTACIIDLALIAAVMFVIWLGISIVQLIFSPGVDVQPPTIGQLVVWGYLLAIVYWTGAWATSGRSLGAWAMGVRVVNRKGEKLSWPMSFLRAIFCVTFPIGLVWALFSKRNRSLQDIALRTIVIYDWYVGHPEEAMRPRETA